MDIKLGADAMKTMTRQEFEAFVREYYSRNKTGMTPDKVLSITSNWFARGDGAAIYRNHDLSSSYVGDVQIVSFGSPFAQLEVDEPPQRLPDIGGAINWQYQLEAIAGRSS